ncbi:ABC transporter [Nanobdella aerobiophila]|uniref:ABC transporter n=1 Tax=Nanobdella aerobiophila TaxID=2586965 RepID=A0A915SY72_9ARCH|nr:ABC transporter permease [Nanobdella aerobiophila]BBL45590.1 ABC transporter [Nanobdella aerobiophila]
MINLDQIYWIWRRDITKFIRDKKRFISSLFQPLLLLFILGYGFNFIKINSLNYIYFLFPGIVGISVMTIGLTSGISLIWDKEFGVFKLFQVSPASRLSIFLGKAFGGATNGAIEGIIILVFSFLIGIKLSIISFLLVVPIVFLLSLTISSIGLLVGLLLDTFESFGAISSFLIFPLMFLSGAFYPLNEVPKILYYITLIDPVTYGIDILRYLLINLSYIPIYIDIIVLIIFEVILSAIGVYELNKKYS